MSEICDGGFACACFGSKVGLARTTSAVLVDAAAARMFGLVQLHFKPFVILQVSGIVVFASE